jgi:predicted TIM-barrel enzyme
MLLIRVNQLKAAIRVSNRGLIEKKKHTAMEKSTQIKSKIILLMHQAMISQNDCDMLL